MRSIGKTSRFFAAQSLPVSAVAAPVLATHTDGDGVLDDADNCVGVPNAVQLDGDTDGRGDGYSTLM